MQSKAQILKGALHAFALGVTLAVASCTPSAKQDANPALWRVSDADSEIYLFGSVHMLPPDLKWRTARIDKAFARADTVYFETPVTPEAGAEIAGLVERAGFLPPEQSLSDRLSADSKARLERVAAKLKLDPRGLERSRPWLAALQISLAMVEQQGQKAEAGVERVFEQELQGGQKARRYFETAEQQIGFLANLSDAAQDRFLAATLRQVEEEADAMDTLDAAWVTGDVAKLQQLLTSDLQEAGPEVYAAIIVNRNRAWAETLDKELEGEGVVFVIVGAAHLIGPEGVPALLAARGRTVEGPHAP